MNQWNPIRSLENLVVTAPELHSVTRGTDSLSLCQQYTPEALCVWVVHRLYVQALFMRYLVSK